MSESVTGGSRAYNNAGRIDSSQARQLRVAEVAAKRIVERGYAGTTMADVAALAEVSVPWLYKVFGPKPALVKRVYDVLLAGDPDPVPMAQRPAIRALAAETDPRRAVERYAAIGRDLAERVGPVAAALLTAARSGEADLGDFAATIANERLIGATAFTRHLTQLGALRADTSPDEARDLVWTLISPDVYGLLVLERGWSGDAYERWLARTLSAGLL